MTTEHVIDILAYEHAQESVLTTLGILRETAREIADGKWEDPQLKRHAIAALRATAAAAASLNEALKWRSHANAIAGIREPDAAVRDKFYGPLYAKSGKIHRLYERTEAKLKRDGLIP